MSPENWTIRNNKILASGPEVRLKSTTARENDFCFERRCGDAARLLQDDRAKCDRAKNPDDRKGSRQTAERTKRKQPATSTLCGAVFGFPRFGSLFS